jgi:hypothetical protein
MRIAILLMLLAGKPLADARGSDRTPDCKANPALVGKCFTVHGRLRAYNGNPTFRIWPLGTKRLIGVTGAKPGQDPIMPKDLACGFDCDVFADFETCPFSINTPGVMQRACIESAGNRVVKRKPAGQ